MGGDNAPHAPVAGAVGAVREQGCSVVLVGDEAGIRREIEALGATTVPLTILHAEEVVGMDEPPITPIRRKRRSSVRICAELVKEGRAQAMISAGNTGAAMIVAKMIIGTSPGVRRPALAAVFPNAAGGTILLDVGANVDTKPTHLSQFAVMGHFFAQEVLGAPSPRIGLLSIGAEKSKGNDLTREVFKAIESIGLNFAGNVEGSDLFAGTVDVIICDGFVGNVLLKSAESLAEMIGQMLHEELSRSPWGKLGYLLLRPALSSFRRRTDYSEYGAAPLLGIRGGCFIGHGRSSPKAMKNAIRRAAEFCQADVHNKVSRKLAELQEVEDILIDSREMSTS